MKPTRHDVEEMHAALMTVLQSTQRARSKGDASRLAALFVVAARPGCSPKAISEELSFHPSSVTRLVQSLEEEGNVRVSPDPSDGRSCRVELTAAGRGEYARLQDKGTQRFSLFVSKWNAEEVRTFTRLLAKFEQSKIEATAGTKPTRKSWRQKRHAATPRKKEKS
jgi:DNA-binding MarR family transcriptional regulator